MVAKRQHIELNGRTIIEKLQVIPPWRQSPVFQDEACFLYFSEGGSNITAPTEHVRIEERESVLLKCGTYFADLFQNTQTGSCEVFVVHFFPEVLQQIFHEEVTLFVQNTTSAHYTHRISKRNVIDHFMRSLDLYFENPELAQQEILYLKVKELVLLLLQTEAASSIMDLYSHLFTPQKASISDVMETHLYSNLTIEQLASLAGQSLSTFKREFRKHFKDTPANYIRNKRMAKAADLLTYSSYPISEISFKIGYQDSSYFSRLFFQKFKTLPSEYRKSHQ
ncbi:helix-turn-helix domain-containing protein [Algoriphagus halophytocola]|uniref:AraC family transcriptional regulator n=1 Tax=Algoriphagus halophytocola TaxID=2991499 RepID=A0ABY6MG56_9BACT|nr:AraC family transcriptional regulator [Algoriphagus sp. TR-M5]UZD22793.1 AraC family transcriptional regulator [Algoriphagus sp. TR-M5]